MWQRDLVIICMLGLRGMLWTDAAAAHEDEVRESSIETKVGIQQRVRGDFATNQNLGDFSFSPGTHDEQLISRTRLNFLFNPVKEVKTFVEGQFYLRENHDDYTKTNLYQAYLELSGLERMPAALKIGRQEMCYGSGFFSWHQ